MVENDFPSGRFLFEDEGVDAGGVATAGLGAGEVEAAGDDGVVFTEHADVDIAEIEMAHGLGRAVAVLVAGEDHGEAVLDGFAHEGGLRGVVVAAHEGDDVAAIPRAGLIGEDLANGVFRGLGAECWDEEECDQGKQQRVAGVSCHWVISFDSEGYYVGGGETGMDSPRVDSGSKPQYTLDELLAECGTAAPITEEDRVWLDLEPVGQEL